MIDIQQDTGDALTIDVTGKCDAAELRTMCQRVQQTSTLTLQMPASSATDYLLIQTLAVLGKSGKRIVISWKGKPPASYLCEFLTSLRFTIQ